MPTLGQVMSREADGAVFRDSEAFALRHEDVVAVRLATGAPCDGHADMFTPWPGPEPGVRCWFQLASGHAVAVAGSPGAAQQVHLWTPDPDRR